MLDFIISTPHRLITDPNTGQTLTVDSSVPGEQRLTWSGGGGVGILTDAAWWELAEVASEAVALEEGAAADRRGIRRELSSDDSVFFAYVEDNAGPVGSGHAELGLRAPNTAAIVFAPVPMGLIKGIVALAAMP